MERTRARVSSTLDQLRDRLSPGQMMDEMLDYARGSGGADFARNLGAAVRDNPVPVMLIGAGIGWLMFAGSRDTRQAPAPLETRRLPPPRPARHLGTMPPDMGPAHYAGSPPSGAGMGVSGTGTTMGHEDRGEGSSTGLGDRISAAGERARDAASSARDRVAGAASSAYEGTADAVSSAYRGAAEAAREPGALDGAREQPELVALVG